MKLTTCIAVILLIIGLGACHQENPEVTPGDAIIRQYLKLDPGNWPDYTGVVYPVHYDAVVLGLQNTPLNNPVTDAGASLGRVLFYDKKLSRNDSVSCASCHQQALGFTDSAVFSKGFEGGLTKAHSMRLGNTSFYLDGRMFWDKRAATLEAQTIQPILDPIEMGFEPAFGGIPALIAKLEQIPYYPPLFEAVYGSPAITEFRIEQALSQFVRSLVSVHSRFDDGMAQVYDPFAPNSGANSPFPNFTDEENLGKLLYMASPAEGGAGCAGCHQTPSFSQARNTTSNGLDAGETTIFKSPSLKNIALAGPYMHDGRFATLEAVIEHYSSGVKPGPALDHRLTFGNGQPLNLRLEEAQKRALMAFLHTLTDSTLINDEKFSNPFRGQ